MATTTVESLNPPSSPTVEDPRPQDLHLSIAAKNQPPLPPLFVNSIPELKSLSNAVNDFTQCYEDLRTHLDSIKSAIFSKLHHPISPPSYPIDQKTNLSGTVAKQDDNLPKSELEGLCKTMCSRGVRKYLVTNLSDVAKLRDEVPRALRLAPNPPKLVLECLGKFFLQGKKAFERESPMVAAREASILVLECFLLMTDGEEIGGVERAVREEAESVITQWRKRLVSEGGVAEANQVDARGLLMFVACFGVPGSFRMDDFRDLIIAANAKEIVGLLQKSRGFMDKLPEIVEGMLKRKMDVDAVDIIYTFGLQERFNAQTLLTSFLRECKDFGKKKGSQGSPSEVNEGNKKQLAALKSVCGCLERHGVDPSKLLPGWQISQKIANLEKGITEFGKKSGERTSNKRKANETDTLKKPKNKEPKCSHQMGHGPQQRKPIGHGGNNRRNSLERGQRPSHHHANYYSSTPSVVYGGPGAGLLPESMVPPGGAGAGISYAGAHGGVMVDHTAGQVMNRGGSHPYDWHADASLVEKYANQPPSVGLTSLYRSAPSVEGFAGAQNASTVGVGSRGGASDLYQFSDSAAEKESYPSGIPRGIPTAVHHPSHLY